MFVNQIHHDMDRSIQFRYSRVARDVHGAVPPRQNRAGSSIYPPSGSRKPRATLLVLAALFLVTAFQTANAQDLLRRSAPVSTGIPTTSSSNNTASAASRAAAAQAAQASQNARDALRRTTQAIDAVKAMQAAARATAAATAANNLGINPKTGFQLPNVPNGLRTGGLDLLTIKSGAQTPVESVSGATTNVTIKQTSQQALLHWTTFNVGRDTALYFDQTAGGSDSGNWIAYNKIFDPAGNPSQILGSIKADGQVYVMNPNGVIFGGNSQVNARGLTVSSLPLNDNLRIAGLLNNPDAQFLFSGLSVPGGSDGTSTFDPNDAAWSGDVPLPADGKYGDVTVQAGAQLSSPVNAAGNGGRIMLVGANVKNEGTISTPNGQTILAAGLQVGIQAHATDDPSLRGLDVFVGAVADPNHAALGSYSGSVVNSGAIESYLGSVTLTGRDLQQLGVIDSSTSVALNGRVDLIGSYGAVGNPGYDNNTGAPALPFLFQNTGTVTFGAESVTRILPDYAGGETVPGTALPEVSQVNVEGLAIHLASGAMILAPNGNATLQAGRWVYKDTDGNRTTLNASGALEPNLQIFASGGLLFDQGQVYLDQGSFINVAGSTEVYIPLSQSILTLKLLGSELADSPLQRNGSIRGQDITVDIRNTGTYNGKYWMGTPLGDVTGFANLIERNAAQLTLSGGNVNMRAGGSAVMQPGSVIDVSGGYATHQGGLIQTTKLIAGSSLIDIADATPDRVYDGVYSGAATTLSNRWGASQTYSLALAPASSSVEPSYVEGGNGGTLKITAPGLALDGHLIGVSVTGPRQRATPPQLSSLQLTVAGQEFYDNPYAGIPQFIVALPNSPRVEFQAGPSGQASADPFSMVSDAPAPLRANRLADLYLSPDLLAGSGFGNLTVENTGGDVVVPRGVTLEAPVFGSIALTGANVIVDGSVVAPGGKLSFTAVNFDANAVAKLPPSSISPAPVPNANRGLFTLTSGGVLNAAGLTIDERFGAADPSSQLLVVPGGSVLINTYAANLATGSVIDVSGGSSLDPQASASYGKGGSISILTGKDPNLTILRGGRLTLDSTLRGYSGTVGGSLTVRAGAIQVGGSSPSPDILSIQPSFFQHGGFTSYSLIGIGAPSTTPASPGDPDNYVPGVAIAPGTVIEPLAEQLQVNPSVGAIQPLQIDRILAPLYLRSPVSVSLQALGSDDPYTTGVLEVRGDIVMGAGSRIATDPGASVSLKGQTVDVLGSITAPGGTIGVSGSGSFPLAPDSAATAGLGRPTVHIGSNAHLSAAGTTVLTPDPYGRRTGTVYPGGAISVSGNIVAEAGAVLDVSGTSALLDVSLAALGLTDLSQLPANSGLTSPTWRFQTLPVEVESSGGQISLNGSEMLFSDATLTGRAGGASAVGGTLSVFSGRFYAQTDRRTGADINLIVTQSGRSLAATNTAPGVGQLVLDSNGIAVSGSGRFVVDRFLEGGFDSLDLGAEYLSNATPVAYGGNIQFQGPVNISARGSLCLAGGGVILAESPVNLSASYLRAGQPFQPPLNAQDLTYLFSQNPQDPVTFSSEYRFAPTFGSGQLSFQANMIDVGTLSLQGIGSASLNAGSGDIRGSGTLDIAGGLFLQAGHVYPTTLSSFNIFAYDHGNMKGAVTISGSGTQATPLSAGGSLNIFASSIQQGGILRAPLGSITLGWDGTGTAPLDLIAGGKINVPVSSDVTTKAGSLTSVSAMDFSGAALAIPLGLSPDGLSWIDPSGLNVTINGLPEKRISLAGATVTTEDGSSIDVRGGGDLYAYRWVRGTGGSIDLLGTAPAEWRSGAQYQAGDLITFGGHTWSARVGHSGQTPSVSAYWSLVPESFAILPDYGATYAPYAANNTGSNASALNGDPGYVDSNLQVGDRIYLDASPGLPAGYYTLLPKGYARLPGAFLVTPKDDGVTGTVTTPDGASYVSGYRYNQFDQPAAATALRSRFEVAPASVVQSRVNYEDHLANTFFPEAAERLALGMIQRLPVDAGSLAIQGNTGLALEGAVLASHSVAGRGSSVDISSFAFLNIIGGSGIAPLNATAVLHSEVLNSWDVESLVIGGLRQQNADGGVLLSPRTSSVTVDNPDAPLSAPEITLVSKDDISLATGSSLHSSGALAEAADLFTVEGDGSLVRVSSDPNARVTRSGITTSSAPLLSIGTGAEIQGASVILDSTSGFGLPTTTGIHADALTLADGQISFLFQDPGTLTGSVVIPHLQISGSLLSELQQVQSLTLQSYRTIDLYGIGSFGSSNLKDLRLFAAGIRGYNQGTASASFEADTVQFGNPGGASTLPSPGTTSGSLQFVADTVQFGSVGLNIAGYQDVNFMAGKGVLGEGSGTFSTAGNLTITTPVIAGLRGSNYSVASAGTVTLANGGGSAGITPELGATFSFTGSSITANTSILLPSGQLTLQASGPNGDVRVGGTLDVSGSSQTFYDVVKYADAGQITLTSQAGNVSLQPVSRVSVAANAGGGDAGSLVVSAPNGSFTAAGTLLGTASADGVAGSFSADIGNLPSYDAIRDDLLAGGFFQSQSFRLRSGNMTLDGTTKTNNLSFSADQGSITVSGTIDASGTTGGSVTLTARDSVIVQSGAQLTVAGQVFNNAGKGGSITLEGGSERIGVVNTNARVSIQSGSVLDLSVAEYVPGDYTTVGSSAFYGQFTGTLHLRAPRVDTDGDGYVDLGVDSIQGSIQGASSVLVEGYQLYDRTAPTDGIASAGVLNIALRNQINTDSQAWLSATAESNMWTKLLTGNPDAANLANVMVIAPGVEIVNRTGDLTLGLANNSSSGSTNAEAKSTADWDLSTYRYGTKLAPGVLTLRAQGDIVFNNSLSDGFTAVSPTSANGNSGLWLALPKTINSAQTAYGTLPVNTQAWSLRLTAGADFQAAGHEAVLPLTTLDSVQPSKGSVLVGEFYPAIPNTNTTGGAIGVGSNGLTANSIRISTTSTDMGTRYEVIRTGAGSIDVAAGRDVQLRNQFATIYTAGVAVPVSTTVFQANDFVIPVIPTSTTRHPGNGDLGAIQQLVQPRWTMAGGDVQVQAGGNAGRYTLYNGVLTADSSRQLPSNWLYRRGYVDPDTGQFATNGGVDGNSIFNVITDRSTSTTWWVDFTNFFEGVGALGGGNVSLSAGQDIVNLDAFSPTQARMPGRDPATGLNVAPEASKLLEWGGGDVTVRAGRDISGGIYYVERGSGQLSAGGQITTNAARSPSLGILGSTPLSLDLVQSQQPAIYNSKTWLPTTLFAGRSQFEVSARGDVLLGPVANTFLLPQGLNNQYWYKTYFNTYSSNAGADVSSFGGNVTLRFEVTLPGDTSPQPILNAWLSTQNVFAGQASGYNASNFQPWLRLVELDTGSFGSVLGVSAPTLRSTAFAGNVTVVGSQSLFPAADGTLELLASQDVVGLAPTGRSNIQGKNVTVWTSAKVNVSDADPNLVPNITAPLAYQTLAGRDYLTARRRTTDVLGPTSALFAETGSYTGAAATVQTQRALHSPAILHRTDTQPVRLFATGGDITGFTLFTPKSAEVLADRDISDVALYLQNTDPTNISIVSAGRDLVPFNENASSRTFAADLSQGNLIGDPPRSTAAGGSTSAAAGDIQVNGPGVLEVLAGRNLDLGTGANFTDGTGVGITSIGNARNSFLPAEGADVIAMAGVPGSGGTGAAQGLSGSSLDFTHFNSNYVGSGTNLDSDYLKRIGVTTPFPSLTAEQQAIAGLEVFFEELRKAGQETAEGGTYERGFQAIQTLFGQASPYGDIYTRARDIRTLAGGSVTVTAPSGGLTMASDIFGNPLAPPGIVTEAGGSVSMFTRDSVSIGQARIFTLKGGDLLIWSSTGDIAAGSAPRTVVTAPPTRVLIDPASAAVETDLGGLATGGGIGVLASVMGVEPGSVDLIAPAGVVDAGDAGIRATGDITIAAVQVLNTANIAAGGSSVGVPSAPVAAAPNLGAAASAASASGATNSAAEQAAGQNQQATTAKPSEEMAASLITAEVIGYGGGETPDPGNGKPEASPPGQPDSTPSAPPAEDEEGKKKKKVVSFRNR